MNARKACAVTFAIALAVAVFLPAAHADEWNQMTKMTFSQPVEIPGKVLPAGTYWFVLLDSPSNRNIVQVFSENWAQLDATLLTTPTDRREATDDTEVQFAERPHQQPEALLKWYYPGHVTGHEFMYSQKQQKEFARDVKQNLEARPETTSSNANVAYTASGQQ